MSGKKASEVNALLNYGEKNRSGAMGVVDSTMSHAEQAIESAVSAEKKAEITISGLKLSNDFDIARKEFPEAAAQIEKTIGDLKGFSETAFSDYESAKKEKKVLMAEYAAIDKEAEDVREKVKAQIRRQGRSDPWYCDDEFNLARIVQNKYANEGEKVNSLKNKLNRCITMADKAKASAVSKEEQARKIASEIAVLQKKASDIVKLRAEASKAKAEVTKALNEIDKGIAEKFLPSEYSDTSKKAEEFLSAAKSKGDQYTVKNFSGVLGEIATFKGRLDKVYAEYVERRTGVRAAIDSAADRLTRNVFSRPEEEFSDTSGKRRYSLLKFLDEYCGGKYVSELNSMLDNAESAYKSDDFERADKCVFELAALTDTASDLAAKTHENRMKTISTAITLQDVMSELGYNVESYENGSLNDGFKLVCTAGDETITYEKVTVDENGKPIIPIGHL